MPATHCYVHNGMKKQTRQVVGLTALVVALVSAFQGCASTHHPSRFPDAAETVRLVATHPGGVSGTFSLTPSSFRLGEGPEQGGIYFFSTRDYRDPLCLTVFVSSAAANTFRLRGEELPFALSARGIDVTGKARRVHGRPSNTALFTDVAYDRIQIDVHSADQIHLMTPQAHP
jgi:hypothetical protein